MSHTIPSSSSLKNLSFSSLFKPLCMQINKLRRRRRRWRQRQPIVGAQCDWQRHLKLPNDICGARLSFWLSMCFDWTNPSVAVVAMHTHIFVSVHRLGGKRAAISLCVIVITVNTCHLRLSLHGLLSCHVMSIRITERLVLNSTGWSIIGSAASGC